MRELRIGRKRRGARKRPASGWQALTPSELEVVRLASEGLTNPEIGQRLFISRRTVQTHLAHAFRKLDISSRVELAAEAARRGGV
jgi:DNA-binding CsgD family transcriptional regulator